MNDYPTIRVPREVHEKLKRLSLILAERRGISPTINATIRYGLFLAEESLKSEEATK